MKIYEFEVEEVNHNGFASWDAIEKSTGNRIALNASEKYIPGSYPEIEKYLNDAYEVKADLVYQEVSDVFEQGKQEWRFVRETYEVFVKDIPRAIFRVSWER